MHNRLAALLKKPQALRIRISTPLVLAFCVLAASPTASHAKDLQGRFGLGYNGEFANTIEAGGPPGVSIKYGLTRDVHMEAVVSVTTRTPSNSVTALKFFKNIFYETNLNFYFMLGGGILSANSRSGAEFISGFGAEFFIPGVESLGLSMETGGSFNNLSGTFALKTLGVSFINAGMHFYF